jgi:MarR family transcriptional regulator, organic hydroperoxide resistance regulator
MSPFTLELIRICRHFGVLERESVCCGTVSVPQCLVLQELLDEPREMTVLAALAGGSISAMTRLVDGLERRGWVCRQRSDDDRRRVQVELTELGKKEATQLRQSTEAIVSAVLTRIPKTKRSQVIEAIKLIRVAMDEARVDFQKCCGS